MSEDIAGAHAGAYPDLLRVGQGEASPLISTSLSQLVIVFLPLSPRSLCRRRAMPWTAHTACVGGHRDPCTVPRLVTGDSTRHAWH